MNFAFKKFFFLKGWGTPKSHLLDITKLGKEKPPLQLLGNFFLMQKGKKKMS
jgi:hypothetical protein